MAKDEFSVNELEPERKTDVSEDTTHIEYKEGSDASYLNHEAQILEEKKQEDLKEPLIEEEYEGPTIKEVIANSVNPDYQGPTAKEIVVNSVKVDNTKNKNLVGLFVFIFVLIAIGIIVFIDVFSEDKKKENNYLVNMPKWVESYNKYFRDNYENIVAYNLSFIDLDFDNQPEAVINYIKDGKTNYEIVDTIDETNFKIEDLSNILMMYSFDEKNVSWYINTTSTDIDMNLINIGKRLKKQPDFEINLTSDSIANFKSNHFNLSYEIKYTKISFRTYEKNLSEAVKVYEKEQENINNIVKNIINKYADEV